MADYTYQEAGAPASTSLKPATLANWAGAAVSLALIVGVGIWGYRVMARDVSGVPLVQASGEAMRVAPKDPGGTLADHQGLAVNAVAGSGAAEGPVDRLVLAPVQSGLSEEDVAEGVLIPKTDPALMPMQTSLAREAEIMEIDPSQTPHQTADLDPIQALANQLAAGAAPLSRVEPAAAAEVTAALGDVVTEPKPVAPQARPERVIPKPGPGLAKSLRPRLRPAGLRSASLAPAAPVAPERSPEIRAEDVPAGTRLVQIGAFDSAENARKEWERLEGRFGEYLDGKARVIQKASSGGRTFYRLRAHGFADLPDARRFCAAFVAKKVDCIPVVSK